MTFKKKERNKTDYTAGSYQLQVAEREVFQEKFETREVKGQGSIHGITVTDRRRYDKRITKKNHTGLISIIKKKKT